MPADSLRADTKPHFPSHGLLLPCKADHQRVTGQQMLLCNFLISLGNDAEMFDGKTFGEVEPERYTARPALSPTFRIACFSKDPTPGQME